MVDTRGRSAPFPAPLAADHDPSGPLRVLILEDVPRDADLLRRELTRQGLSFVSRVIETREDLLQQLHDWAPDVVLADYSMPHLTGTEALGIMQDLDMDIPFILISGTVGEDVAVEAMRRGAHDYLIKGNLGRLGAAIERELRSARIRAERRAAQVALARANGIIERSPAVALVWLNADGWPVDFCTQNVRRLLGWSADEITAETFRYLDMVHRSDLARLSEEMRQARDNPDTTQFSHTPYRVLTRDGAVKWIDSNVTVHRAPDGRVLRYDGILFDATTRVRSQRVLSLTHRVAGAFLTTPSDALFDGVLNVLLEAFDAQYGYFGYIDQDGNLICPSMTAVWDRCEVSDKEIVFPRAAWAGLWGSSLVGRRTLYANEGLRVPAGHARLENALVVPIVHHGALIGQFGLANTPHGFGPEEAHLLEAVADQTAPVLYGLLEKSRRDAVEARLESQLRQAQKMEAVGRLAGGVAHDFNNLLQVINGYAEMASEELEKTHPVHELVESILDAGRRSARLVSQLLAFSRRQTMRPEALDLDEVVGDTLKMLSRVIGEHIRLEFVPGHGLRPVHADRGMIEQVLMNLCVNARDAMPRGGVLTLETRNATLDAAYCAVHLETQPGDYVELAVSDTGSGMSAEVQERLFEPFFTTKEMGKGTGLGLATVYGIVKQHDGAIEVESDEGRGSTFRIYLPALKEATVAPEAPVAVSVVGGDETVLLVEDSAAVRHMTRTILERAGYRVLTAGDGAAGVSVYEAHREEIDLVLLDLVMPEMGGREAYERMSASRPQLPVVFASGYSEGAVHADLMAKEGAILVPKPFARDDLLSALRRALDHQASDTR